MWPNSYSNTWNVECHLISSPVLQNVEFEMLIQLQPSIKGLKVGENKTWPIFKQFAQFVRGLGAIAELPGPSIHNYFSNKICSKPISYGANTHLQSYLNHSLAHGIKFNNLSSSRSILLGHFLPKYYTEFHRNTQKQYPQLYHSRPFKRNSYLLSQSSDLMLHWWIAD